MKVKDILEGKVIGIYQSHVLVKFKNDQVGILHISQASDYFVFSLNNMFEINGFYWFEIMEIDPIENRITLSWKNLVPRFLKNPFDFILEPTANDFKNLKQFVKEKLNA